MKRLKMLVVVCFLTTVALAQTEEKPAPILNVKLKENLSFTPPNTSLKIWLSGRIQADGALFMGEDYQPLGNGVGFRRLRLGANIEFGKYLFGKIEADFSNGGFSLKDAFIQYKFTKSFDAKVGNFKEGVTMESLNSSGELLFMERPNAVNAFAPDRHIGIQGTYRERNFLGIAGIHFQEINGSTEKGNTESNNKRGQDEGISYTGRVVWMPRSQSRDKGLHIGLAASYRTPKTDVKANSLQGVQFSTPSLSSINKIKFLDTGLIPSVDHDWLAGIELAGYCHAFRFQSEYIINNVYRNDNLPTQKFNGYYAQAGYLLFGGQQKYSTSRGAFTQPDLGRSWGDIELAARFDRLDLNGTTVKGGAANNVTLGVNYYINKYFKVQVNYSYINQDKYANADGQAFVGYDDTGALTANPSLVDEAKGQGGNRYNSLSLRFQLNF